MLSAGWLVLIVLLAVLLTSWNTFTATRLDRLHARVDAAQAALDAQLVRRVAAMRHAVEAGCTARSDLSGADKVRYEAIAQFALTATGSERQSAENEVGRVVSDLCAGQHGLTTAAAAELRESAARVLIARRFYNDAVRDTRALRTQRMARLLHLAGQRAMPQFFDIDDTLPAEESVSPANPEPWTESVSMQEPMPSEQTASPKKGGQ